MLKDDFHHLKNVDFSGFSAPLPTLRNSDLKIPKKKKQKKPMASLGFKIPSSILFYFFTALLPLALQLTLYASRQQISLVIIQFEYSIVTYHGMPKPISREYYLFTNTALQIPNSYTSRLKKSLLLKVQLGYRNSPNLFHMLA